jgi:plasmid stabilization system protein ParE
VTVRFLAPAREEFLRAVTFYERQAPGLGAEFYDDTVRALDMVSSSPHSGAPFEGSMRRLLLQRFPYSIIYQAEEETILVVAVAHQRRRPGYWKDRLE